MIVRYVEQQDILKAQSKEHTTFVNRFKKVSLKTMNDLFDEYLDNYSIYDAKNFNWFLMVCQNRGFNLYPNECFRMLLDRKRFWMQIDSNVSEMNRIDRMSGTEFEEYISHFFQNIGYRTNLTKKSYDLGCDILIWKNSFGTVVQCKRQKDKVSVSAVQQAFTAKRVYKTFGALVVTNSSFSTPAEVLADIVGVELWDRRRLRLELRKKSAIRPIT
jgi:hypothetical protein